MTKHIEEFAIVKAEKSIVYVDSIFSKDLGAAVVIPADNQNSKTYWGIIIDNVDDHYLIMTLANHVSYDAIGKYLTAAGYFETVEHTLRDETRDAIFKYATQFNGTNEIWDELMASLPKLYPINSRADMIL